MIRSVMRNLSLMTLCLALFACVGPDADPLGSEPAPGLKACRRC